MQSEKNSQRGFKLNGRKLFIGIPCYDGRVNATIAFGLAQLMMELPSYGIECTMAHLSGCSVISKARNSLVAQFVENECTDLMFIDSDIEFNPNDIIRLMGWATERDIVGGVIPTRRKDAPYIATLLEGDDGRFKLEEGLVEARRLGTAFMLIRDYVIKSMIKNHSEWAYKNTDGSTHHSLFDFTSTQAQYIGEDYTFCDRARADGFRIFIDPAIKLDHYGNYKFEGDFGRDVIYPAIRLHDSSIPQQANLPIDFNRQEGLRKVSS